MRDKRIKKYPGIFRIFDRMVGLGLAWFDFVSFWVWLRMDTVWFGLVGFDLFIWVWFRFCLIWFGLFWFLLAWFWFGLVWPGLVLVWFSLVWFGLVLFYFILFEMVWDWVCYGFRLG